MRRNHGLPAGVWLLTVLLLLSLSACSTMPTETIVHAREACRLGGGNTLQKVAACELAIHSRQYVGAQLADLFFMKGIHQQIGNKVGSQIDTRQSNKANNIE